MNEIIFLWITVCMYVCIFEGIMDAQLYTDILRTALLPFLSEYFPGGHRFMQVIVLILCT